MRIYIEPGESLLFRTGRPFEAGEGGFAESLFPPTPETLQGAIRAAIATQWGLAQSPPMYDLAKVFEKEKLCSLIGNRESYGRFRITGITLGRRNREDDHKIERLFPAPAHILNVVTGEKEEKKEHLALLSPQPQESHVLTNLPPGVNYLLRPKKPLNMSDKASALSGWLTAEGLQAVLSGGIPDTEKKDDEKQIIATDEIYQFESRLGIGMDTRSKTTKESHLYQARFVRMREKHGFVVDIALASESKGGEEAELKSESKNSEGPKVEKLAFLRDGLMSIGGEQRAARIFVLDREGAPLKSGAEPELKGTGEKQFLYFATPTFFQDGWKPKEIAWPAPLMTAAINKYQNIGGWQLEAGSAGGQPKTTHRCVPAGSVYFFDQAIGEQKPITEHGWQIGYGITYTGVWYE